MSDEVINIFGTDEKEDETASLPDINTAYDLRPDLSELGVVEHERGVCEDTAENRTTLRRAGLKWDTVYDGMGSPMGLIIARSEESLRERRILSLTEKRPLLSDPTNNNSDFLTGLDLILEDAAIKLSPPWVVAASRKYIEQQRKGGSDNPNRKPLALPHRCRTVKTDGIRCMLWSSGRPADDGLCRLHLGKIRRPGQDVERARAKIVQSAAYAVDVVEELMESAQSEPVRLKAATEILDRAGVRGGVEIDVGVDVTLRSPADIIAERLQRLASSAVYAASLLPDVKVIDAEPVMEDSTKPTDDEGPQDDGK
jgi:hypothetical protein